ncbi:MAG: hypothetical protein A2Z75_06600 [Chloroflexi bacterium RBG_13_50_10]|nr:MAG: hypothetical protein A2Z75_06600 [Chloroflexi bacterium RBG_13_50_10]
MLLQAEAKKLTNYINSLGFNIPLRKPSHKHVGAIIADAVLQGGGHRYKTQVKPRVERMRDKYPVADTVSGLSSLLKSQGARTLLNWSGKDEQQRFRQTVAFFLKEQINTFDDLRNWLKSEANRYRLITKSNRVDKAGIAEISDATADYYRVLVRLPDAVKVDSRVEQFLADAGINTTKYRYKDLRTIVQLAAKQLRRSPLDLEGAIWNCTGKRTYEGGKMTVKWQGFTARQAKEFSQKRGYTSEVEVIETMKRPEDWKLRSFDDAKRGNYLLMWRWKGEKNYPSPHQVNRNPSDRWQSGKIESFHKYLKKPGGIAWQNKHKPNWLQPMTTAPLPEAQLTIGLPVEQEAQFKRLAGEWGVDTPVLARIWILERLRQLRNESQ